MTDREIAERVVAKIGFEARAERNFDKAVAVAAEALAAVRARGVREGYQSGHEDGFAAGAAAGERAGTEKAARVVAALNRAHFATDYAQKFVAMTVRALAAPDPEPGR